MKIKCEDTVYNLELLELVTRIYQIADFDVAATILSKITGKGSLLSGTGLGALADLPVGSDGQILSCDSAEVTGLKWVATSDQGGATLTNKSGTNVATGAVVIPYTSTASCFTTTTYAVDNRVIGVAAEDIDDNAEGKVLVKGGVGTVMVTGTVAIGDKLCSSTTAQRARTAIFGEKAFATAMTALASGTGTVTAVLDYPLQTDYKLLGTVDDPATGTGSNANYLWLQKHTATRNGMVKEFRIKAYGAANVKCALYADNAGAPGALITYTASTAVEIGWNSIASPVGIPIVSGTVYWIGYNLDSANGVSRISDAAAVDRYVVMTYADPFPNPPSGLSGPGAYRQYTNVWG